MAQKINRTCQGCGNDFLAYACVVRNGGAKFCTMACKRAKQAQVDCICEFCGVAFRTYQSEIRKGGGVCCSVICRNRRLARLAMRPAVDRFWDKVIKGGADECWPWTGTGTRDGYGMLKVNSSDVNSTRTNRFSYELHFGPIPKGLLVLHTCDNPPCVNPAHLFLGTDASNMADRNSKGRQARGERQGFAKLNEQSVREIRARYKAGGIPRRVLATEYGVCHGTIQAIIEGRTWKHVTGPPVQKQPSQAIPAE